MNLVSPPARPRQVLISLKSPSMPRPSCIALTMMSVSIPG